MFERFTDRARRVVVLAQEEARMLGHNYIGTEHLLLGLIHEGGGIAAKALESLGIELRVVRAQVEDVIGRGQSPPTGHVPFTPRAKKVLELSLREAMKLNHNYIGTEHILLGLIREGESVGAEVLSKVGADLNAVRERVATLLGEQVADVEGGRGVPMPDQPPRYGPRDPENLGKELMDLVARGRRLLELAERLATELSDATGNAAITRETIIAGMLGHPAMSYLAWLLSDEADLTAALEHIKRSATSGDDVAGASGEE